MKRGVELPRARPFLKWAGGKGQLVSELGARLPERYGRYFEPFLGGGALFFSLGAEKAALSDVNEELVNAYRVVRDELPALIEKLKAHVHDKDYFYRIREMDRSPHYQSWSAVERASRFLFLNKTCYNGLHRVNSKGFFNVPFGAYRNPTICDAQNLIACQEALRGVAIECRTFLSVEELVKPGDFVYFDPPYVPLDATSNFTTYAKDGFGTNEQWALRDLCERLDRTGVLWMLSNSSASVVLELYSRYRLERVPAARAISSNGGGRGKIDEVIVRNY